MKHESFPTEHSHQLRPGADFLQFAVAFAQLDLERLRPGDWLNLRDDFELYMGRASLIAASGNCILAHPVQEAVLPSDRVYPLPEQFEPQDFKALQEQLLPAIQSEAASIPWATMYPVAEQMHLHALPGRRQTVISAPATDCFLKIFRWLLDQEPPDRILACPECHRFFYRVKQQAYCTRKCGNRLVVREWRVRNIRRARRARQSTGATPPS